MRWWLVVRLHFLVLCSRRNDEIGESRFTFCRGWRQYQEAKIVIFVALALCRLSFINLISTRRRPTLDFLYSRFASPDASRRCSL